MYKLIKKEEHNMTVKLNNGAAAYFMNMVHGVSVEDEKQFIIEETKKQNQTMTDDVIEERIGYELEDFEDAAQAFAKFKPYEKSEEFAVNGWGYDQTNYENIEVVGQIRGTVIILGNNTVYGVSKKKFVEKAPYTDLDNVRSTNWEKPYTPDEMLENSIENVYTGH